ncbi:MAG: glutamine--tRNA ligase/YqeY domain fusion protein [Calditrichia bacterium]
MTEKENAPVSNFLRTIIEKDLEKGKNDGKVQTRFPPEPNGYLHIGHAKSICVNFGLAKDYNGLCNLRFDDTNPTKEDVEYVDSIKNDVKWLGFDWDDRLYFASDYFSRLHDCAIQLIKSGDAYVESLSAEDMRTYRGTLTEPGKNSPFRDRSVEENLALFAGMKNGDFAEGEHILRAKIDMASPNMNMRDPALYRILKAHHHRTGDEWKIYPMYDFAHGISDAFEGVTHSLCTLEFEDHRPLYDWFLEKLNFDPAPHQYEFARLEVTYTLTSKRKLNQLVTEGIVDGWDDPRMPTLAGMRRRGYTPEAVRDFCERIGVAKSNSTVDFAMLSFSIREHLNRTANRVMAVLDPLKVVITNYPDGKTEELDGENNPEDEAAGNRKIPFSREIYIERADFLEDAPRKFFRLSLGKEVRLKHAYYITCNDVIKDNAGNVTELHCTYDQATRGGWSDDGRKVKGTLHWVSIEHAIDVEARLYDQLFTTEDPAEGGDFLTNLNPESLIVLPNVKAEPYLANAKPGENFQFLRKGYYVVDRDSTDDKIVFNRTVTLRDGYKKK